MRRRCVVFILSLMSNTSFSLSAALANRTPSSSDVRPQPQDAPRTPATCQLQAQSKVCIRIMTNSLLKMQNITSVGSLFGDEGESLSLHEYMKHICIFVSIIPRLSLNVPRCTKENLLNKRMNWSGYRFYYSISLFEVNWKFYLFDFTIYYRLMN